MKIAKVFDWEMGHRLPFHKGKCKNLHGHSYKLRLEVEGDLDEQGMLIDFYDVKKIVNPIIENLDHACMVYKDDKDLIDALVKLNSKFVIVNFHSTAENICKYFVDEIKKLSLPENIKKITARIYETEDSYAEENYELVRRRRIRN